MKLLKIALVAIAVSLVGACGTAAPTATSIPPATSVPTSTPAPTATPTVTSPSPTATPSPRPTATLVPPTAIPPTATLPRTTPTRAPTVTPATAPVSAPFNPALTGIRLEKIGESFRLPVDIKHAGDNSGRLFVVEKRGTIRILRDGSPSSTPFLDITPLVRSTESERGLLGLAFHPQYRSNRQFFVYYTDNTGDLVIARYMASSDPDRANPDSGIEILRVRHRDASNHNGGHLAFGPDGYLYIGTGDGGGAGDRFGNSQKPDSLLAKMLRIDVNGGAPYSAPKDNPFVSRSDFRPEVWAWGLRNPWRFSFDRATGDLYIADVGQNVWEEINFQPANSKGGENYGWSRLEGNHCFPIGASCDPSAFVAPVAEYSHDRGGCSVTGGHVYRGKAQPALTGAYFFGDYCSGKIWSLHRNGGAAWVMTELLSVRGLAISTFGEDEQGEIYTVNYDTGDLYRIVAAPK